MSGRAGGGRRLWRGCRTCKCTAIVALYGVNFKLSYQEALEGLPDGLRGAVTGAAAEGVLSLAEDLVARMQRCVRARARARVRVCARAGGRGWAMRAHRLHTARRENGKRKGVPERDRGLSVSISRARRL